MTNFLSLYFFTIPLGQVQGHPQAKNASVQQQSNYVTVNLLTINTKVNIYAQIALKSLPYQH